MEHGEPGYQGRSPRLDWLVRGVTRLSSLKMIYHLMNNLQIFLLEGPDSLINFAFSAEFDERRRRLFDLGGLLLHVQDGQLAHWESLDCGCL